MLKQPTTAGASAPTLTAKAAASVTTDEAPTRPHDTAAIIDTADNGLVVTHRFYPSQEVWAIVNNRKVHTRIIKVEAEHRSAITTSCQLNSTFRYTLADGSIKSDTEVFATEEELKQWL